MKREEIKRIRKLYSTLNKESRCSKFSENKAIPNSYKDNTLKEELVLEHLIQYRKEFANAIDPKRDLFLYPMNETSKFKFICTTIRSTKVPYPELYEYNQCAKFLADFIEYEELNPPNEFPKYIPSPENVMLWQIGDCFDISIALCSLLIGAGYDAYCVYGKAPRFVTTKDESNLPPPDFPDDLKVIDVDLNELSNVKKIEITPYKKKIISETDFESRQEKDKNIHEQWVKENVINDDEPELRRYDPLNGKRLHCWVLLKPNKRLEQSIFVEPVSGRLYDIEDSPFEMIDAIFNNNNFWINLDTTKPVKQVNLDLNNTDVWEFVMLSPVEGADEDNNQNIIDMPPPWSNKIYISQWAYHNRVPLSTQTFYFQKTKVEKFSVYSQIDGRTLVIYKYKDFARLRLEEVEIRYRNRRDKLFKTFKYPYQHKIVNLYLPGQENGWKRIEEVEGTYKKIDYFDTNFDTGLIYREEIFGKEIVHKYRSRDDRVFERKIELRPLNSDEKQMSKQNFLHSPYYQNRLLIFRFTEKYLVNPLELVSF